MTRKYTRRPRNEDGSVVVAARGHSPRANGRAKSTTNYLAADGLDLSSLPNRVQAFRNSRALAQGDLARLCGVTRQTVVRWETVGPGRQAALVTLALTCLAQRLAAALVTTVEPTPAPPVSSSPVVEPTIANFPDFDEDDGEEEEEEEDDDND